MARGIIEPLNLKFEQAVNKIFKPVPAKTVDKKQSKKQQVTETNTRKNKIN